MKARQVRGTLCLLLLGAAGPAPADCGPPTAPAITIPADTSPTQPSPAGTAAGFGVGSFASVPAAPAPGSDCGAFPFIATPGTLQSESSDVLHGLPSPDILRYEPKPAPLFR